MAWREMSALILWMLACCYQLSAASHQNLDGHQIWKLSNSKSTVPTQLMIDGLLDVLDHSRKLQHVRVARQHVDLVHSLLQKEGISYEVMVHDLASHVEEFENSERRKRDVSGKEEKCVENNCPEPLIKDYMRFNEMEFYLKQLNKSHYPKVSLTSLGKSHEGRDIWLLRIKSKKANAPAIWIEGGIHAREWISPAVAMNLISKTMKDENIKEKYDFFFAPMTNPDGYEFTFKGNRYWRKNRRPPQGRSQCYGVDLNRNWDFHYGVGASSYACSEVFMGSSPFSEPETKVLKDAILKLNSTTGILMLLSLHSYGEDLLYPWGWTSKLTPDNLPELLEFAKKFIEGEKEKTGEEYSVINSAGGLYLASGATDDWAKGAVGIRYVYTLELRDKGTKGFLLNREAIKPTVDEVWNGLQKSLTTIS